MRQQLCMILSAILVGCSPGIAIVALDGDIDPANFVSEEEDDEGIEAPTNPVEGDDDEPDPTPDIPDPEPNPPTANSVIVYTNNVENLPVPSDGCAGDWKDLVYYFKKNSAPDIFLVQQIANIEQLKFYVAYLTRELPGVYAGIIAENYPAKMLSPCGAQKAFQTNAIIFRKARFIPRGPKLTWRPKAFSDGVCRISRQARTLYAMQKFYDVAAQKEITVASTHWATRSVQCARGNAVDLDNKLRLPAYQADLTVLGGDMNAHDRTSDGYLSWYALMNGDRGGQLNYRDVLYYQCLHQTSESLGECLSGRIDFLMARKGLGKPLVSGARTVTFPAADAAAKALTGADSPVNYSDHRAVGATIRY